MQVRSPGTAQGLARDTHTHTMIRDKVIYQLSVEVMTSLDVNPRTAQAVLTRSDSVLKGGLVATARGFAAVRTF